MKPLLKSVCITPAASGAEAPIGMVQARTSFSPAVKNVCLFKRLYADLINFDAPAYLRPKSSKKSNLSSKLSNSFISASVLTAKNKKLVFSEFANSLTIST